MSETNAPGLSNHIVTEEEYRRHPHFRRAWEQAAKRQATTQRFFDMQAKAQGGHKMAQSIMGRFWAEVISKQLEGQ